MHEYKIVYLTPKVTERDKSEIIERLRHIRRPVVSIEGFIEVPFVLKAETLSMN